MDIAAEVVAAEKAIRPHIRETYLEYSPFYNRMTGAQVYFKLENLQHTGSFKLRSAMSKLLSLTAEEKQRGVVTASTGNHGAAFAYGLGKVNGTGVVSLHFMKSVLSRKHESSKTLKLSKLFSCFSLPC